VVEISKQLIKDITHIIDSGQIPLFFTSTVGHMYGVKLQAIRVE
jgi:hypothetical protein